MKQKRAIINLKEDFKTWLKFMNPYNKEEITFEESITVICVSFLLMSLAMVLISLISFIKALI